MPEPEDVILQEIDKELDTFIDTVFSRSQQRLIDEGKVDTANLLKSGNVTRKFLEKQITYSAPYSDVIEYGRFPGSMPPPEALEKWVRRKLGVRNEKEVKRVAFTIAMAIKKRGMDGTFFLTQSLDQTELEFQNRRVK